ncbi:MAG: BACON domain-containing protein [Alistipes sp.]|nr:BACON domain-containing protein [Alistipes sp.]
MNFKTIFSTIAMLMVVALVGCKENPQTEEPNNSTTETTFTLETTSIEIGDQGGPMEVKYTITNNKQGSVVLTNCKDSWIQKLSTANYGKISFTVSPNYTSEERETVINVTYTGLDEKFDITIKQSGTENPMFQYEVATREPDYLSLNITPADLTTPYITRIYTEDHIKAFGLESDAALASYDMSVIENEAYYAGQTTLNYLRNISHTGKAFDVEFTRLFPDTNYVVYSYHIDLNTGKIDSNIYREVVRTAKPTTIDANIEMECEVNGARIIQTITPADKEMYYYTYCWSVSDFYSYYGQGADMREVFVNKWNETVSMMVSSGYTPYQIIENNCLKGDQVITLELEASKQYAIYLFAVNNETAFSASEIQLELVTTSTAAESGMTIDIEVKDIFPTTANVYWTASDPNGRFVRAYFTKAEFDSWGTTDEEKIANFTSQYGPISVVGQTDMNLKNLTPSTTYVAFAYGLDGEAPNTRIFYKEFTTLSDTPGNSNISLSWNTQYNIAEIAALDAEHWGSYAEYTNYALVPMAISGVTAGDEVYLMVTTMPIDYYNNESEWLRDVAKQNNKLNLYSNYNFVAEYDREYTVVAVAKDANGNYGTLFLEEMIIYASDNDNSASYVYQENE